MPLIAIPLSLHLILLLKKFEIFVMMEAKCELGNNNFDLKLNRESDCWVSYHKRSNQKGWQTAARITV